MSFYNVTQYARKILKTDNEGFPTGSARIQPTENREFDIFVGHSWLVEMYAADRNAGFGPIIANQTESCQAHTLWNDGIGIDAGYCDF